MSGFYSSDSSHRPRRLIDGTFERMDACYKEIILLMGLEKPALRVL